MANPNAWDAKCQFCGWTNQVTTMLRTPHWRETRGHFHMVAWILIKLEGISYFIPTLGAEIGGYKQLIKQPEK